MKKCLNWKETLSVTSMLFGLFFGAGNLIFPVFLGQNAGNRIVSALFGFIITGVGMPMLAVVTLGITGSYGLLDLSQRISKTFGYIFTCVLYLTIGPFFACPRCVTVPFEIGVKPLLPAGINEHVVLFLFSLVFFLIILYLSLYPGKLLTWTGNILNPLFLIILSVLILTALMHPSASVFSFEPTDLYRQASISQGILDGYNTMDALAGLAFGIVVVDVIKTLGIRQAQDIAYNTIRAGIFSCLLMGVIYILVAFVGAQSRAYTPINNNGGQTLAIISTHYFSSAGNVLLAGIVLLACLKTVVGLITSCSKSFEVMFPNRFRYKQLAVAFSLITFIIANIGLSAIIQFSIPVLMMLYPISIVLIGLSILDHYLHLDRILIQCTMCFTIGSSIFDLLKFLPQDVIAFLHLDPLLLLLKQYLPFFNMGFGWILPTVVGAVIGVLSTHFKPEISY